MAIELGDHDHDGLDAMLDGILSAVAVGRVTRTDAREVLAHVFTAAALGNNDEVREWLAPRTLARWQAHIEARPIPRKPARRLALVR